MPTITKTSSKILFPYGKHQVTDDDIQAVTRVLQSEWLTQGPVIQDFEKALTLQTGAKKAVACANGTAALHLAMLALGIKPGDTVVTTPITFLASANCARYVGADVLFTDIDPATACLDPNSLENVLKNDRDRKIKAIIPVHFAGQPCNMVAIRDLSNKYEVAVIEDASHAIGSKYYFKNDVVRTGSCVHSDMTVFSFHPVKHVAMGEGGAITTNDDRLANRLSLLRNHG
ncbi:MAG: UDP-4-amino-4,6-dideoxy-N-acetyl-beta-L-altrosamine transaminase, partial [Candidatus Zixiibacteriota bacterium]